MKAGIVLLLVIFGACKSRRKVGESASLSRNVTVKILNFDRVDVEGRLNLELSCVGLPATIGAYRDGYGQFVVQGVPDECDLRARSLSAPTGVEFTSGDGVLYESKPRLKFTTSADGTLSAEAVMVPTFRQITGQEMTVTFKVDRTMENISIPTLRPVLNCEPQFIAGNGIQANGDAFNATFRIDPSVATFQCSQLQLVSSSGLAYIGNVDLRIASDMKSLPSLSNVLLSAIAVVVTGNAITITTLGEPCEGYYSIELGKCTGAP